MLTLGINSFFNREKVLSKKRIFLLFYSLLKMILAKYWLLYMLILVNSINKHAIRDKNCEVYTVFKKLRRNSKTWRNDQWRNIQYVNYIWNWSICLKTLYKIYCQNSQLNYSKSTYIKVIYIKFLLQ